MGLVVVEACPVVSFDMELTLVNSEPGVTWGLRAVDRAMRRRGAPPLDIGELMDNLGPPMQQELPRVYADRPAKDRAFAVTIFQRGMGICGMLMAEVEPHAHEALATVHAVDGTCFMLTGRNQGLAERTVRHFGFAMDGVHGGLNKEGKAAKLDEIGAHAHVGDHLDDVWAANEAGVLAVAVATGKFTAQQLDRAGADIVLPNLSEFASVFHQ